MNICIAGKNNIAVDVTKDILRKYPESKIWVIPIKNDIGKNGFQMSFFSFAKYNGLKIASLEQVYSIPDLLFLSLELDQIICPGKFKSNKLYNIHFSLLPAYKGMYTSTWPILNRESFSGVTFHKIDRGIDTGEILLQKKILLDEDETAKSLYLKYIHYGTLLITEHIEAILKGDLLPLVQSYQGSSYYSKKSIDYHNIIIDLNATAYQLSSQIRAFIFRDYQMPLVKDYKIRKVAILDEHSHVKAGEILEDNTQYIKLSTIDYNVILFKDYYEQLLLCCESNDEQLLKQLISFTDNLEEKNKFGWTPLIVAAYNNAYETAMLLLQKGADVNAYDYNGMSVLMHATIGALKTKNTKTLDLILLYKPNIEHKDLNAKNIFDYARYESKELFDHIKRKTDKD